MIWDWWRPCNGTFKSSTGVTLSRPTLPLQGRQVRMPSEYETVLFRITQEALNNIARHADASHATIRLEFQPSQVCVEYPRQWPRV